MKPKTFRRRNRALSFLLSFAVLIGLFSGVAGASSKPIYNASKPEVLYDKNLYAESAVLIDQHSGRVLYNMKGTQKMHPASITKIMTLLLALENGNLDDVVVVGSEVTQIPGDSSRLGLIQGEKLTLEDLLHGMMIKSGNDASMTIAKHIGGSVDEFITMMNARAKELGCQNTRFTNPHGYEHKNHYTTAWDMALIARAGMNNETFREIVNTAKYTIPKNNKRSRPLTLTTTNPFISSNSKLAYYYPNGTGIKTGYFSNARHTVVSSASKDGMDLIAVVLKTTKEGKWVDSTRLMDYGFAVADTYKLGELYSAAPVNLPVVDSASNSPTGESLALNLSTEGQNWTFADNFDSYQTMFNNFTGYYVYNGPESISGPLAAGTVVGTLDFYPQEGNLPITFDLVASQDLQQYSAGNITTTETDFFANSVLVPSY